METVLEKSDVSIRTPRDTSAENAVKTLQWLLKSVNNLKTDVNQINQSLNVSKTFQHADEVQKQIHLVQVYLEINHFSQSKEISQYQGTL